ncbi:MAG: DUF2218 domain-containing protein, partial [Rhizobium sp.]|nr:DUF2218 domain-containing protein [Rhizobium sp.]
MTGTQQFRLSGTALPKDVAGMLDEICEHFVEHSDVQRNENHVLLNSEIGSAGIRAEGDRLLIELACPTAEALQLTRTMLAEHLFYFAGEDPFELSWSEPPPQTRLANLQEAIVVSAEDVTPRMRRVKVACADVSPYIDGDIHVRLLVPPRGRPPVWPGIRADGRLAWPEGQDALLARVYTIRAVDVERRELWIDILQHPAPGGRPPTNTPKKKKKKKPPPKNTNNKQKKTKKNKKEKKKKKKKEKKKKKINKKKNKNTKKNKKKKKKKKKK